MKINAETLRSLRLRRGWTQQHLAETADLSLRTVQRVESDGAASQETVMSLCAALEVSVEDLYRPPDSAGGALVSMRMVMAISAATLVVGAAIGAGLATVFL